MKATKISNLTDKDVLALDISTNDGCVVLSKGTVLSTDYIKKLHSFGIKEVYVEDELDYKEGSRPKVDMPKAREITLQNYRQIFSEVAKENTLDTEKLFESTTSIISAVLSKIEDETLDILYTVNPYFCHYTHALNTAALSIFLGIKLDLSDTQLSELASSALLHDVGMYKLPADVLEREGSLTDEDVAIVKKHTIYGYETAESAKTLTHSIKKAILHHHEKFDGTGYPFRLKGKNIPLYSRIIAIADIFCSLTTKTSYHSGYSYPETYEFILASSGKYFDPDIVDIFRKHFVMYPNNTKVTLTNGQSGTVISQNQGFPDRPVLRITKDSKGIEILPITVNLIKKTNLKIDRILT
ncbi:MAG: HD-GYP domain-containing protein [Clostridium sp.]